MSKIKLKEWAEKHNLSYLTANRHFHAGMIPGAVQLDSGTILVEDDSMEQNMAINNSGDAMSVFLKKTVEFSKNNSSVEDFAAFVISNFQLKLNGTEGPRYSKNKPKTEEIQKHFQQFIPDQKDIEHLKIVKSLLKEGKPVGDMLPVTDADIERASKLLVPEDVLELFKDVESATTDTYADAGKHMYGEKTTEGQVTHSVDLNTTPQQINYTGSPADLAFGSQSPIMSNNWATSAQTIFTDENAYNFSVSNSTFQPTQKERLSVAKVIETAESVVVPRKRGRKSLAKK